MTISIPSISISYKGEDADNNRIDLGQLGQSIQGAAKLLGASANLVATGQYAKKSPTFAVRVLASAPQGGSVTIVVDFASVAPIVVPLLPTIGDAMKEAARQAVEAIANYVIAKAAKKDDASEPLKEVAVTALAELGHTNRTAVEALTRIATGNVPAVRQLVSPVGQSCATLQVGGSISEAVVIDKFSRAQIDSDTPIEIGPEGSFELLISELDLKNKSCKFRLRDDDDPDQRLNGEITDPLLALPNNPYSHAIDKQAWLNVRGKPQLRDGEVERIYISDVEPPPTK
jgi:hypothetical protein